jgi:error-prone DNA polymerase
MSAYVELAAASNFSFLRGASHPEELIEAAQTLGLAGLALTDRNSLAGVVRAHQVAKANGVRFIAGARLVLQTGVEAVCLPTDRAAYGRLCQLLTTGNLRAPKAECHLWLGDVLRFGEGQIFIVLPGAAEPGSDPRSASLRGAMPRSNPEAAFAALDRYGGQRPPRDDGAERTDIIESLKTLARRFPRSVYLGASLFFDGGDARRLARLASLAQEAGTPLVAVGDCLYHHPSRKPLQDVLTCIREKCTVAEAGYRLQANAERHLKAPAEILRLYRGYESAVARTLEIAGRCRFSLDELRYDYPDEPYEPFASPQEALTAHTWEGAAKHYPAGIPDKVKAQIDHELELIGRLGYARYFLTVFDLVRFARSRDILCQGRGSAANSAVCYCLGITSVNPAEIDLLFERFISAERNEPPDIDVDFEHERREEVMQYIYGKYGRDRAGIVATTVTYRAKSAIREAGKALGLPEDVTGAIAGLVWGWPRQGASFDLLREAGLDPADRGLRLAVQFAETLTGFPRHLSQHTGGFVITKGPLDTIVPIGNAAMDGRTVIEWNKDDLDALGLLKIDVLALGMLTCVRKAFELLRVHYGIAQDLASIPQGDAKVYDMICKADTIGVFQVESRAQMSMLPRLKPRCFYDLVIEVAIVRPGPIQGDMVHPYLRRRQGLEKVRFPSEELREVLGKTLGVPLFQEQAMKIAIVAAGFTPGEADQLRRAMATFRHAGTIHSFGTKLIEGMKANGYEADFAERCFRQIEGFGEYGFPESHAASFALLVYVSSWLKCHFPDAFACALLNSQPMGFYAPAQIVRDFCNHGGEAHPPDINCSDWDCTLEPESGAGEADALTSQRVASRTGGSPPTLSLSPWERGRLNRALRPQHRPFSHGEKDRMRGESLDYGRAAHRPGPMLAHMAGEGPGHALRLGFRQVKGLSPKEADAIVAARGSGPFSSLEDFVRRTALGAPALRILAEADAFRSIGLDRRQALWRVARYLEAGTPAASVLPLFAETPALPAEPDAALPAMPLGEHVLTDYATLRLSLKAHPMALLRPQFADLGYVKAETLAGLSANRMVRVAGIVLIRQRPGSASGVIFSTLEDETGIANLIIWPKIFERFRRIVLTARLLGVRGLLQSQDGAVHVVARELTDLSAYLAGLSEEHSEARKSDGRRYGTPAHGRDALTQVLPKGRNFQ